MYPKFPAAGATLVVLALTEFSLAQTPEAHPRYWTSRFRATLVRLHTFILGKMRSASSRAALSNF